jgi:hypothetical protein
MVKKLEKGKTAPKIASRPPKKQVQEERDEKVEYARSVFLNARRPHIKSRIVSYPVPRKRERSLHTCAQDVQITCIVTI